jgi:glycyl-tRNA synthetase (class II)
VLDSTPGEDPVRHRPDRQELSQRDHAAQLHVPLARIRADGDRVLLPSRPVAEWYQVLARPPLQWYTTLGLAGERLRLREHDAEELSHYSTGTADIEYAFPFLPPGEFGELEGIAHRGDFDLRSHMEGKLDPRATCPLEVEDEDGKPRIAAAART